jgi:hypothetical protein
MTVAIEVELTPEQNAMALLNADFMGCTPEIALEIAMTEYLHENYAASPTAIVLPIRKEEGDE